LTRGCGRPASTRSSRSRISCGESTPFRQGTRRRCYPQSFGSYFDCSRTLANRLKTVNVGEFGLNSTREPSQDGKRGLSGPGLRLGMLNTRSSVSLFRCRPRYAPVLDAGPETRRLDCFASSPAMRPLQSTCPRPCRAEARICIRGLNALSRRSSDVAWEGLCGRRLMCSEQQSQSGSPSVRSFRHVRLAGHRVHQCIRSTGSG
jgi:hypothetical protein